MKFETIETERLVLKKLRAEDYNAIFRNFEKPQIMKLLDLRNEEEYIQEVLRFQKGYSCFKRSIIFFQLIEKVSGQIIGSAGYHNWYSDHFRAELGYSLRDDKDKNKGYMTEAVRRILAFGFDELHLHRIEAYVSEDNVPSIKIMKNFGFHREGLLREHYFSNGIHEDSIVFSLLKSDWEQAM